MLFIGIGDCRFAYVRQEDLFFSQLTVRETLSLAAELQLPEISSVEEKDEYVNNLLFKLGLVRLSGLTDEFILRNIWSQKRTDWMVYVHTSSIVGSFALQK